MKNFSELPAFLKAYINDRFANHGIIGKEAYDNPNIFPIELKQLSPDNLKTVLEMKEISHIMPRSKYPELANRVENIVLEDKKYNRLRSNNNMSIEERDAAMTDLLSDVKDGDINEDGIVDFNKTIEAADDFDSVESLIGISIFGGIVMSGIGALKKIKSNEIKLNDVPQFLIYDSSGKIVKVAIIGTLLSSGMPIVVGGTSAYLFYRSRNLLYRLSKGIFKGISSEIKNGNKIFSDGFLNTINGEPEQNSIPKSILMASKKFENKR